MGKVQYLIFTNSYLILIKFSFLEEDETLVYNFVQFWDFPEVSLISLYSKSNFLWKIQNLWGKLKPKIQTLYLYFYLYNE